MKKKGATPRYVRVAPKSFFINKLVPRETSNVYFSITQTFISYD